MRFWGRGHLAKVIAIWGVVAISCALLGGIIASVKRRDVPFWAAWNFLVPPMLLLLLLMPSNKSVRSRQPALGEGGVSFRESRSD